MKEIEKLLSGKLKECGLHLFSSSKDLLYMKFSLDMLNLPYLVIMDWEELEGVQHDRRPIVLCCDEIGNDKEMKVLDELLKGRGLLGICKVSYTVDLRFHKSKVHDLSKHYKKPIVYLAEFEARWNFRRSIFFNNENGVWHTCRTSFMFPFEEDSLEQVILRSISSSKDILKSYDEVRCLRIIKILSKA
jgi:hypothetical protein